MNRPTLLRRLVLLGAPLPLIVVGLTHPRLDGLSASLAQADVHFALHLAHAANNVFWELFAGFTVGATPLVSEYLAGESGILTLAAYALLIGWLVYRLHRWGRGAPALAAQRV